MAVGASKLIIEVKYGRPLNFSIVGKSPNNLSDGTFSPLLCPSIEKPSSSIVVDPRQTNNGTFVLAIYNPPDFINEPTAYKNIIVSIKDSNNTSVSLSPAIMKLYHPPVVLVHGL